ncbi:hypothetical protein [Actinokineospora iranica]|uniref:Uncharacterized protein n=1 Tax=Actinokineospora iranica TaxID=1271860 RepID=A0A1G6MAV4_9PSEU|nr:hypothetical protein [Actinokineospora iranica]SDC52643.1 hypothetical protein SAMN05216174_102457 [Actinokineospora iranica]
MSETLPFLVTLDDEQATGGDKGILGKRDEPKVRPIPMAVLKENLRAPSAACGSCSTKSADGEGATIGHRIEKKFIREADPARPCCVT